MRLSAVLALATLAAADARIVQFEKQGAELRWTRCRSAV